MKKPRCSSITKWSSLATLRVDIISACAVRDSTQGCHLAFLMLISRKKTIWLIDCFSVLISKHKLISTISFFTKNDATIISYLTFTIFFQFISFFKHLLSKYVHFCNLGTLLPWPCVRAQFFFAFIFISDRWTFYSLIFFEKKWNNKIRFWVLVCTVTLKWQGWEKEPKNWKKILVTIFLV